MKKTPSHKLLGIRLRLVSKKDILEYILKFFSKNNDIVHIVSLNPEICVQMSNDIEYRKVIEKSQIHIIDGIGVQIALSILGIPAIERITGIDLMNDLFVYACERRLRVLLIGGGEKIAERVADCQHSRLNNLTIRGIQGVADIRRGAKEEEMREIVSIVADFKPHMVFVAFGSPYQEKWIWQNRALLKGKVCMGVGQAFDVCAGRVTRAPLMMRKAGFEWLFRLLSQPWRVRRQLRIVVFIWLILRERIIKKEVLG